MASGGMNWAVPISLVILARSDDTERAMPKSVSCPAAGVTPTTHGTARDTHSIANVACE
jgi:hypothetical protein